MRIFDLLRIAAKNLKGRWVVLPVVGIAISTFCFCFAGAVITSISEEKSLPYELNVSSGAADISDSVIAEIYKISKVTAATPIVHIPVRIEAESNDIQLTLTGIDTSYLDDDIAQGGVFPDSSIMPYLLLNEGTIKQLEAESDDDPDMNTDTSGKDWLSAGIAIKTAEGARPIVSKISGVLAEDEEDKQEPAAYISLSCARQLLQQSGQVAGYTGARVRVTSSGYAQSVSDALSALGLAVANSNEQLQAKWDTQTKEMTYLFASGVFCLLCSMVLFSAWRKIAFLEQKEVLTMLQWIGIKKQTVGWLFAIQSLMMALLGIGIGIIISGSLPSFLSPEVQETSIFAMQIPFSVVALSTLACVTGGLLPMLNIRGSMANELI